MEHSTREWSPRTGFEVAVVGLAGRFPGADDVDAFWLNLCAGVDAVSTFDDEQLVAAGVGSTVFGEPNYVRARGVLRGVDLFDAPLFGYSPREAEMLDPQQRLFLETAWQALESAGHDPARFPGAIGVFAGSGISSYLIMRLAREADFIQSEESLQILVGNDKDYLATRVAYKLDLKGPAVTLQCACSTGLVCVHMACQSLIAGDSDMALAGAAYVRVPQEVGYPHQQGGVYSPDGRCRAFDARAQGTVPGNGVGVVVLRRLEDALADGDDVLAVIKGIAVNNDGSAKVGYTAPSVEGETRVLRAAHRLSGIDPRTISYVEAHGSGTALGDPIEISALSRVFGEAGATRQSCAVGSVKSNIGHLDVAASIAGFIKTVLALRHHRLPASLHVEQPNPRIDFGATPFYVNTEARDWNDAGRSLRAGVSSFGIGGTNVHAVLEEAPPPEPTGPARERQVLLLSARTPEALDALTARLATHLAAHPELPLADVAYTLQVGRRQLGRRRLLVADSLADAAAALQARDPRRLLTSATDAAPRGVAFLFSGYGSQHVGMGADLFREEPLFRAELEHCADVLRGCRFDLLGTLYPPPGGEAAAAEALDRLEYAQPALFAFEYSLARLLMSWGVTPAAMLGHSLGEYVAACLAGVFSLDDGLRLVARRAKLMHDAPHGAMLSVALPGDEVTPLLPPGSSLAAANSPIASVVSGRAEAVAELERDLAARGIETRRFQTPHAAHSAQLDGIVGEFERAFDGISWGEARRAYISNVSGTWADPAEVATPRYWARHMRGTVRFADGVAALRERGQPVLLEVGPGNILASFARQCLGAGDGVPVLASLRRPKETTHDVAHLLTAVGRAWLAGAQVDWEVARGGTRRRRIPLPDYPFERQRYWWGLSPEAPGAEPGPAEATVARTVYARPGLQNVFVAPRNETEWAIAGLWQDVFGIERVGVHDDFFDLGGNSLLAIQLVARLQQNFDVQLSLSEVLRSPTILDQARSVREARAAGGQGVRATPLVKIQVRGTRPPFFCVHPAGGIVHCYIELARCLGREQPFYALQHPGVDGDVDALRDFDEMAATYLESVRAVQPRGPYFLGGWSFGGTVAFEMARQLRAGGETVAFLGLMDTPAPAGLYPELRPAFETAGILTFLGRGLGEIFGNDMRLDPRDFEGLSQAQQFDHFLSRAGQVDGMDILAGGRDQFERILAMFHAADRAERQYRPEPYDGPLTMYRVQAMDDYEFTGYKLHPDLRDPAFGWNALSSRGVEVRAVPGTHMTMVVRPHVDVLARELAAGLQAAQAACSELVAGGAR